MKVKAHKISMAILYVLIALVFAGVAVFAAEVPMASEQSMESDQQYAAVNIQTEMPQEKQKQKMSFHFSMFTVNIQHIHTELIPIPTK